MYATATPWAGIYKDVAVKPGKWYTFSVTVTAIPGKTLFIFLTNSGSDKQGLDKCVDKLEWKHDVNTPIRLEMTFYCYSARAIRPRVESYTSDRYTVCQYKLEEGQKATPWCPNEND